MNYVVAYHDAIRSGAVVTSRKVARVYEKLVQDLTDPACEWEYDERRADHAIFFIEKFCKHSKGPAGGRPFLLELWQKALVAATFGFIHKIDGVRRFREVALIVARKNGKSTLAAAIGIYLMVADQEAGAEIYAAATKKDQAKIIWLEAKRMVNKSPVLKSRIKPLVAEMCSDYNDSTFKPLGSDSDTLDGLNVHGALLDEIHAWKSRSLYDVIVDGTSAREQPLIFITSTAGTIREAVYDQKYDEYTNIIKGYDDINLPQEDRVLPLIYELDNRDEWTKPECWAKANPGLGTIKKLDQLEDKVRKAQADLKLVKNLLTKDFDVRETTSEAWLEFEELNNEVTFDVNQQAPCYAIGGADLSATTDLTAAVVLYRLKNDPNLYVLQMYWMPEELIEKRVAEDKIPYDLWREQGLLRACAGNRVDYKDVTAWFAEVQQQYGICIAWVGYDPWGAPYWKNDMENTFGGVLEEVRQGKPTLSNPMKELGAELRAGRVVYNNNPILKWCMSNVAVDTDKNLNIQPCKTSNQRRRIDGFAALLDAYVVYTRHLDEYVSMVNDHVEEESHVDF
jgi:phage terminase large subunit-like protein